jgi:hypothetical protein
VTKALRMITASMTSTDQKANRWMHNFRLKLSALEFKRTDAQTAKKVPSMMSLDGAAALCEAAPVGKWL